MSCISESQIKVLYYYVFQRINHTMLLGLTGRSLGGR